MAPAGRRCGFRRGLGRGGGVFDAGLAEVAQFDVEVGGEEEDGWFDVTVEDVGGVDVGEGGGGADGEREERGVPGGFGSVARGEEGEEGAVGEVLEDDADARWGVPCSAVEGD